MGRRAGWLVGLVVCFRAPRLAHQPVLSSSPSGLIPKDYRSLKTQYLQVWPGERLPEVPWWRGALDSFERGKRRHGPSPVPVPILSPSGWFSG